MGPVQRAPNPFADATVPALLDAVAAAHPHREAIVFHDERITFAELRDRGIALAGGLAVLGVRPGDAVAIWMPNRPSWFAAQHACARLGAMVVALNPRYKAHELRYILGQSGARALILTDRRGAVDYLDTLHDVVPGLPDAVPGELQSATLPALRHVIVDADDEYAGCVRLRDLEDAGGRAAEAGIREESRETAGPRPTTDPTPPRPLAAPGPDDVFALLYTSGTTSFPKGAMITHRNCVPHAWNTGQTLRLTPDDRVLHAMPAAGTWGGLNIPLSTWSHGACLVLMEAYDPLLSLVLIERERCTVWNAVDMMAREILTHPDLDRYDRSSLRTGAFAAVGGGGHGLFEAVVTKLGIPFAYQPYGMTEVNALALWHDLDEPFELRALPGIAPAPGLEVRVVNPVTGAPCKAGERGELEFRGPLVTRGYYQKPEETAAAFTPDGWFKSGDLGVQDGAGHTIFEGRLRDVLRISHFMVAPGEIEAVLMSHPLVDQAFVVGVPDARTNEAAVAYVIRRAGAELTENDLRTFCRGQIASYKIPTIVRFVTDVPRTSGPHGDKVQRGKLREAALRESAS
jgi:fatty-acyl-CoA synthase